jgi:hypothetical protein
MKSSNTQMKSKSLLFSGGVVNRFRSVVVGRKGDSALRTLQNRSWQATGPRSMRFKYATLEKLDIYTQYAESMLLGVAEMDAVGPQSHAGQRHVTRAPGS